jgi:hypothetical protein
MACFSYGSFFTPSIHQPWFKFRTMVQRFFWNSKFKNFSYNIIEERVNVATMTTAAAAAAAAATTTTATTQRKVKGGRRRTKRRPRTWQIKTKQNKTKQLAYQ